MERIVLPIALELLGPRPAVDGPAADDARAVAGSPPVGGAD